MLSVVNYTYNKRGVTDMSDWGFSSNWPVAYVIYNDESAYVGETLDAIRRTEQHLQEESFSRFSHICLISDRTFNKSVILDLESFLIKHMSADGLRRLTNANVGIVNHEYFYREAYEDEFEEVWRRLIENGLARSSLVDIENSELFKYSPYKSLNDEQQRMAVDILTRLHRINRTSKRSMLLVNGGAGTGKSILAVYVIKLLADMLSGSDFWDVVEDSSEAKKLEMLGEGLKGISKIGFVVPMKELYETMKSVFKSVEGLSEEMVLRPHEVVDSYYNLLVVDEAHRLYRKYSLTSAVANKRFNGINRDLMGESFSGTESDLTELDWIIKKSDRQLLFYDEHQSIRVTDIGKERFSSICRPLLDTTYELTSQMRCKGGNGYYEYVRRLIMGTYVGVRDYRLIEDYHLKVCDSIEDLFSSIDSARGESGLCKVTTGPGWGIKEEIVIGDNVYHWASGRTNDDSDAIFSVHKVQGFDLNYAGVIFGREVYFDESLKGIAVDREKVKDPKTRSRYDKTGEQMREFVLNIYVTLMTRGIQGTFVYAVDPKLQEYLSLYLG